MTGLRILVADDHEVVREGVKALLATRRDWEVCGEATSGAEAVKKAAALHPDIVVLDLGMPGLNGLDAARQILAARPEAQVLFLTLHESEQLVREVLATGARGYVLKSDAAQDLVTGIEALGRGRPFISARVSELVLDDYRTSTRRGRHVPGHGLTPREEEVLRLVADGKTSRQVAGALGIGLKTVETHRLHVMRKLGLHSVGELVRFAVRHGLIEP